MKKRGIALALLVASFILILTALVNAQAPTTSYNVSYRCEDDQCIEGQPIIWTISFFNYGGREVEYTDFELVDAFNHTNIAELHIPYYPLRDYRGDILVSWPNKKVDINISATVPISNSPEGTTFYPCFSSTIEDIHVFVRHNDYTYRQCYSENFTLSSKQCMQDSHCKETQYCGYLNTCVDLNCANCQYVSNHSCLNHECCSSEQCLFNQRCDGNLCVSLQCQENQFIYNRTCQFLACNVDEMIMNQSCQKLSCSDTEFVFNHTCKPLLCSGQEYVFNHTCRSCAQNQYLDNGVCMSLKCKPFEGYVDHTCKPLQCRFYEDIVDHECKRNIGIIIKLGIEGFIVVIAAALIFLDLRKIRRNKAEQSVGKKQENIFSFSKPKEEERPKEENESKEPKDLPDIKADAKKDPDTKKENQESKR